MNALVFLTTVTLSLYIGYRLYKLKNELTEKTTAKGNTPATTQKPPDTAAEPTGLLEERLMMQEAIAIIENLSESISASLDINELAGVIVRNTAKILNANICTLLLLDERTDTLSIIASVGIENESINTLRIKKGEEISGVVAKFNAIKVINNLAIQESLYQLKYEKHYKETLASIPLSLKSNVIGVLNVSHRKTGKPFSSIDIEILKIIALESAVALQNLKLIREQHEGYLNTIIALASTIDARDPYTYSHSNNVTKYAVRLAEELKLPNKVIEDIKYAGLLHDIGKIGIRDEVLLKPAKLTEEEFGQIKKHPLKGEEIIKSLPFLKGVSKIIRQHHESFNGRGYPDGIKGEEIDLSARILKIADFFDAITTDRPYRKAFSLEEAKAVIMQNKGTELDPRLTDCFLEILEKEPGLISNY